MLIGRALTCAAALLLMAGGAAMPAAGATPPAANPGDPCGNPAPQTDTMSCDMQAGRWVSKGPNATVGQPCSPAGDVRLSHGEDLAHCSQTGIWRPGVHD